MKVNSQKRYFVTLFLSFVLLIIGGFLAKQYRDAHDIMATLPYILIGLGGGIFGQSLGKIITLRSYKKHPEAAKLAEIDEQDERNITIRNKSKAAAFDLMVYTFGALIISYALFNASLYVTLSSVAAYLFVIFSEMFFFNKYSKKM